MSVVLRPDGPGTTVEINSGLQGLPPAPRGTGAIMGTFQSGPIGRSVLAMVPSIARITMGNPDDDHEASLSMGDVYFMDAPPMMLARITDGNEVKSTLSLWDRNPFRSFLHRTSMNDRPPLATVSAQNGGRWAGRRRVLVGESADMSASVTGDSTFDTAVAALKDVWKDSSLSFEGDTRSYEVVSNTVAGVLTIKGEFSQDVIDASNGESNGITGKWRLVLSGGRELSAVVSTDNEIGEKFSVKIVRKFEPNDDWESIALYENLGLSSSSDRPWTDIMNREDVELNRFQAQVSSSYSGENVESKFPANYCEIPISVVGPTITFQWYRWTADSGNTGNPYLESILPVDDDSIEPHIATLSFISATTANVTVQFPDGTEVSLGQLTLGVEFDPSHPQLSKFTVNAGSVDTANGDSMQIRVNTLPNDLASRDAFVYPCALSDDGNSTIRFQIVSSDYRSVTVRSDLDMADYDAAAPESPSITGTADISGVTWTAGETIILSPDGMDPVTFTSPVGDKVGKAAILAELALQDTDGLFVFSVNATDRFVAALAKSVGSKSSILVGNGTANATFGLTNGTKDFGADGIPARLEGRFPMWGGYDGDTPDDADYLVALDPSTHVFKEHGLVNLGLVTLATPGVTSSAVKSAVDTLVCQNAWFAIAEFSQSLYTGTTQAESAVADMIANESQSDYVQHYFPSHGKFLNVSGTKIVTRSLSGIVIGLRSRLANRGTDGERGYHIAAANSNSQGLISPRCKGLPDGIGRWQPPVKVLNDNGIVAVMWSGPDVYLYGNRMYSKGRTPKGSRYTITERQVYYHVARDLFVTTRPLIFKSISVRRLADVIRMLRGKMKTYFDDGWFSDYAGAGFEDQVLIETPPDLNQPDQLLEGLVTAVIQFTPKPAMESLRITISPLGVNA